MRRTWIVGLLALGGCDEDDDAAVPHLTLTSPAAADWSTDAVTVSGIATDDGSGIAEVTVNGAAVTLAADGSFSHTLTADPGALAIVVQATDEAGNRADARAAVLVGERMAGDDLITDAARLHLGAAAIDALGAQLDPGWIDEPVDVPLASLDSACGPVYLSATWLSLGISDIALVPTDAGLQAALSLSELKIALEAEAPACGITTQGSLLADGALHSITALSVDDGEPVAETVSAWAELSEPRVELGALGELLADPTLDSDLIGALLAGQTASRLAEALADMLGQLTLSEDIHFVDQTMTLDGTLSDVAVSADGVTLAMDAWSDGVDGGSLRIDQPQTLSPTTGDLSLSVPLNTLNHLLHGAWASGGLTLSEGSIDNVLLAAMFSEARDVRLDLEPVLPPIISPQPDVDGHMFAMDLPAVRLSITGQVGTQRISLAEGQLSLSGGLDLVGAPGSGITLQATIGDAFLDLSESDGDATEREALEDSLETLLSLLTNQALTLGHLPAPTISELPVGLSDAGPDGDGHWIRLEAALR